MPIPCNTHVEGAGCAMPRSKRRCEEVPAAAQACADTGDCSLDSGSAAEWHVEGSGAGCSHTAPGPGWWVVAAWVLWRGPAKRWLAGVLAIGIGGAAQAVDIEGFEALDGSPVPGMVDPALGPEWSPRLNLSGTTALAPVRLRAGPDSEVVVRQLQTVETALSLQISDWMVVGLGLPTHHVIQSTGPNGARLGDPTAFLRVPMRQNGGSADAFEVRLQKPPSEIRELGARVNPALLWTTTASASLGWVSSRVFPQSCGDDGRLPAGYRCPWWLGGRVAARLQPGQALPGITWGSRWEGSVGLRRNIGRFGLGAATTGSAPLRLFGDPTAAWPLEWNGFGSVRLGTGAVFQLGGGSGLTRGLGAPQGRIFAGITWLGQIGDPDHDGYLGLRDLCPKKPEDRDQFRDGDGCPEPDNDRDGLLDVVDRCPLQAEVFNGWRDEDGCPDALATWRVSIASDEPVEKMWVELDGVGAWEVASEFEYALSPGEHAWQVKADGFVPVQRAVRLAEGELSTEIRLEAVQMGAVMVSLIARDDGAALAGTLEVDGQVLPIGAGSRAIPMRVGHHAAVARAPGHLVETVRITVPRTAPGLAVIHLDSVLPLSAPPEVAFSLGSSQLVGAGLELIETLAAWLRDHPEIRLLRVEGHADEVGGSAYNLRLSLARAQAVTDALVARGIDVDRLHAIGAGESRSWLALHGTPPDVVPTVAGQALREVAFQVLVWDDEGMDGLVTEGRGAATGAPVDLTAYGLTPDLGVQPTARRGPQAAEGWIGCENREAHSPCAPSQAETPSDSGR